MLFFCLLGEFSLSAADAQPPNFIIILADDLGYGDLACYGHPTIRTPNLDRMAAEGMRFTDFYASETVCTPSRSGLMTGRLPIRTGMCSDTRRVLFPNSAGGLQPSEITIASALKAKNYATACVGKWHLGHLPQYLPTHHGFDHYYGIPYSNDMDRDPTGPKGQAVFQDPRVEHFRVPLMRDETIIERPANQTTLTQRYTAEAVKFIQDHQKRPFFLYFAHTFPHVPLFASANFKGKSPRGIYGDVVEEIDWSVGQILDAVRQAGLAENTLVFFTSDNGPWLIEGDQGGSAGLLREGKGSTWEGGMREPGIAWWPGKIKPAVNRELACNVDLLPTFCHLAGAPVPNDRVLDGVDMTPMLLATGKSQRDVIFYYRGTKLYAVRKGAYKAHYITQSAYGKDKPELHDPPALYNLERDPSEQFEVAKDHPEVLADIAKEVEQHRAKLVPGKPQLEEVIKMN